MKQDTKLVALGRGPATEEGTVNLPVQRASTILSPDLHSYIHRFDNGRKYERIAYGALGTQNDRALAEAVCSIEEGYRSVVTASGLSAVTMALAAFANAGDHILITDSVYGPTRSFCLQTLARYNVETEFYDPALGENISSLFRANTRLVFMEAPGSLTFEMQDVPAIAAAARAHGVVSMMDNTWASPLYFKPLLNGVDISIQAGTKYIAGHSDLVIGIITVNSDEHYKQIVDNLWSYGDVAGPDDCFLALRGLRTLSVRLPRQADSALRIAGWLSSRPEVSRVLHPALPDDPGHSLWKRDFTGASSLFGLALHRTDQTAVAHMVDGLKHFQIGSSWGGYESLLAFNHMPVPREVIPWTQTPFLLRLHIGLEDPEDLLADLEAGFERLAAV